MADQPPQQPPAGHTLDLYKGEIKTYRWTILDKDFEVVFLVDPKNDYRKNGCLFVAVNGENCFFKFTPGKVPNNDETSTTTHLPTSGSGWTEFVYEGKTYILTYQSLPGKDHKINWCIHIPKR